MSAVSDRAERTARAAVDASMLRLLATLVEKSGDAVPLASGAMFHVRVEIERRVAGTFGR